ncbi:monocarboxylate/H+ symporter LALA0_S06e07008g [Lachancea lanzarotensis]|uniref:LALA0S06e07008g1_1 n=1 Tax=Lachancea lanzarotensis TaxID=1245769 RepID=A0A0C7N4P1_9SACH|nr:uncharacterized protein LALA0_S06e07008g [Lachancea lanzarotensis]CEP62922.1 LALA0S06e07008g1_1 [Lachancea lanzarotensis]
MRRDKDAIASSDSFIEREVKNSFKTPRPKAQHDVTWIQVKKYLKTRLTTLFPTKTELKDNYRKYPLNPFPALACMNAQQTQFFVVGLLAWTWDALDFFAVSLNMSGIAKDLDKPIKDVTHAITLVLLLRVIGAVIFGYLGDRFGRKLPYCISMALIIVIQIATGFVKTFPAFLGCRALFGIVMGSIYGVASATSLENAPEEAKSILSGIFQEGYALGYLLGVVFKRAIVDNSPHGWRAFFWFSAGPPVLFIVWRLLLPESQEFAKRKALTSANEPNADQVHSSPKSTDRFWSNAKAAIIHHWITMVYLVILMAMFNFSSHGSQDLFPTMLTNQYDYSENASTVTNSVANIGALVGGIIVAHASSFIGRRCAIFLCCIGGGALLYPWGFVSSPRGLNPAVFFLQFFVQGAWGVVPIHLTELSPVEFRAFVTGVAYQMGNMISSASSTIEATIGERFPIEGKEDAFEYGKVMCIFMGCVFAGLLVTTVLGPENKGGQVVVDEQVLHSRGSLENRQDDLHHFRHRGSLDSSHSAFKPTVEYIARVDAPSNQTPV